MKKDEKVINVSIDGIGFNATHLGKMSESEFMAEFAAEPMAHIFEDSEDRQAALKEAYATIMKKVHKPVPTPQAQAPTLAPIIPTPNAPVATKPTDTMINKPIEKPKP